MSRAETAAAFLREARLAGRREPAIPEACAPRNEDEAKAVWQALHAMEDRRIVGWKIGATAAAAQQAMGLSGPFAGHICEGMVDEGAEIEYRLADLLGPIYESEYGFRLSADLPARAQPYSREEVEAAIGSLIAGIELPERRLADNQPLGPIGTIADHGGTGRYIVAHEFEDWRGIDCVDQEVSLTFNGVEAGRGTGRAMMGHPVEAVRWLANHLSGLGLGMTAGQFVTTGSCTGVLPVPGPDTLAVSDFGPLGRVRVNFAGS